MMDFKHDTDCPCFGDTVEHFADCGNCICEKPDCAINMKPGWRCTRKYHSDGPCALVPEPQPTSQPQELKIPDDLHYRYTKLYKILRLMGSGVPICTVEDEIAYIERIARVEGRQ